MYLLGEIVMPLSLRLPHGLEAELAGYSARAGLSKSAIILRSVEEFMARHAQPSAHELYLRAVQRTASEPKAEIDPRPRKQAFRTAVKAKHAKRAAAKKTSASSAR
jgi:hypothetical protein